MRLVRFAVLNGECTVEKKELILQPRLALLASLVTAGASIVDVGTDHGYLPVYLLRHGVIAHAVASDINALPLAHAKRTAAEYGVTRGVDFRLCAGLDAVSPHEVDTVVVAGMGGETIVEILKNAPWTREKTLLLQPMTKPEILRVWLTENGYVITRERLVRDKDTLYAVLTATGGESAPLTPAQAYCGAASVHDLLYGDYVTERIAKLTRAAAGLHGSKRADRETRAAEMERIIEELERSREEWEHGNGSGNRSEALRLGAAGERGELG